MQHRIAIYDLDRTVLATPTFTAFLVFAARTAAPWRLAFVPIWLIAMLGYAAGLYGRDKLKPFGVRLMVGDPVCREKMHALALAFADRLIPADIQPGALTAMGRDDREGFLRVLATAAPEFYAEELGRQMGFTHILATRHLRSESGDWYAAIAGTNCYGPEKRRRILLWMAEMGFHPGDALVRFYTDDISDKPTLELAQQGFAINPDQKFAKAARQNDWEILDFRVSGDERPTG